jgi:serine phosphatase RsbU (regulator of sigma subunit)
VDQELHLARQIQQGLLPGFPPVIEGFEVLGNNLPSRQVSGDLFGWWPRGDGKWLFCLADVSGKGMGPGLLMASLQATLEAWTDLDLPVSELALRLSRTLGRHTDGRRFVTAFLLLLDPASGAATYTNAGHNPALLIHPGGACEALGAHGRPLALLPDNTYGESPLHLGPGDLVAMYTDGITEAEDPRGDEFGLETLTHFLAERCEEPLMALDAKLMAALDGFSQGRPYLDDRTLLLVRRNHQG